MVSIAKKRKAYKFGLVSEYAAIWYLRVKGCRIMERRYRNKMGEVDIIARRRDTVIFVEVKARHNPESYEVVTTHQQQRVMRAALLFIAKHPEFATLRMRFDVIIMIPWRMPRHISNAWGA